MQKHAQLCGAKNPKALTSTKLRKHLATLTQVFNMTTNDIEQLATFMGHTINVHSKVYRLPDDIFQTAKIAKLLMLMERGDAAKYKGKTLEEIDVKMDEEIDLDRDDLSENTFVESSNSLDTDIFEAQSKEEKTDIQSKNPESINNNKTKKREIIPWTTHQKKVVLEFFKGHIKSKKPPKKAECNISLEKYPDLLKNKSWPKIKVFIQNCYTKKAKLDADD